MFETQNTKEYDIQMKPEKLLNKYRDYIRHLTKNYTLSDQELDLFISNWNKTYDISQMSLKANDNNGEKSKLFYLIFFREKFKERNC